MTVNGEMILHLPFPPSLNNLFINVRGRGRAPSARYLSWQQRATQAMWGQRIIAFTGRVEIAMTFEDVGQSDLDNLQKSILDHLVRHRLIKDDSRKIVRRLVLEWGDVRGAVVKVSQASS